MRKIWPGWLTMRYHCMACVLASDCYHCYIWNTYGFMFMTFFYLLFTGYWFLSLKDKPVGVGVGIHLKSSGFDNLALLKYFTNSLRRYIHKPFTQLCVAKEPISDEFWFCLFVMICVNMKLQIWAVITSSQHMSMHTYMTLSDYILCLSSYEVSFLSICFAIQAPGCDYRVQISPECYKVSPITTWEIKPSRSGLIIPIKSTIRTHWFVLSEISNANWWLSKQYVIFCTVLIKPLLAEFFWGKKICILIILPHQDGQAIEFVGHGKQTFFTAMADNDLMISETRD